MEGIEFFILGLSVYICALLLPPLLAAWSWNKAPRHVGRWPAHFLFGPLVLLAEWCLVRLLFFDAHDDGEGPPGLGFALIPYVVVLLGTLAVYYFGVVWEGVGALWRALNDRLAER